MANTTVNKVIYNDRVLVDLSNDTVSEEVLASGYTAHDKSGKLITGTLVPGGGGGSTEDVLLYGFSSGEVEYSDNGTVLVAHNLTSGEKLTKTFTKRRGVTQSVDIVWTDSSDNVLGRLVKDFSSGDVVIYRNLITGETITKTFNFKERSMVQITKDSGGSIQSELDKTLIDRLPRSGQ